MPGGAAQQAALAAIREIVGERGWIEAPDEMRPFLVERRGLWEGRARAVVRPGTRDEVARVVGCCARAALPIVPQGGNTSLCGGSVPDPDGSAIVLSLSRLGRILALDPVGDTITVEAGCVLADVQAAAASVGRLFPLSLAAEGSCEIGGNLSTNAGGVHVLRFGTARNLVLGLEVVLPDGRVWDGLRALRKDNTGYDLKQLFLGAEGTLGVITAAVLRLFPAPADRAVALIAVPDLGRAVSLLARARRRFAEALVAFEWMPRIALDLVLAHIPATRDPLASSHGGYVLAELHAFAGEGKPLARELERWLGEAAGAGALEDAVVARSGSQAEELWRLRESVSEAQTREGPSIKHDVAVPVARLPELLDRATRRVEEEWPGVRVVAFGHAGDGNLHLNLSAPRGAEPAEFLARRPVFNRIVHDLVCELGGSIAAEHGVGRLKREEIARYKSPVEIELMRRLKRALDPLGIMNPGRVV